MALIQEGLQGFQGGQRSFQGHRCMVLLLVDQYASRFQFGSQEKIIEPRKRMGQIQVRFPNIVYALLVGEVFGQQIIDPINDKDLSGLGHACRLASF